ncbi:hypothetical protein E2C01_036583 [Portunus trituberculatus]|uniref:Uncharacterized protein n=1 Tax=Portunus trituberculatus TaxID=210409 RepID=A0A5B7FCV5_PORTR|nr:hypothetical protein [Portunus trituberculatus]
MVEPKGCGPSNQHNSTPSVFPLVHYFYSAELQRVLRTSGRFAKCPVPWWNAACTNDVREKRTAFFRLRRHRGDPQCLDAFRRCRARARRVLKKAQRASWKAYASSIYVRTPLTDVFNQKSAELLGSILLLPRQFCSLLCKRWQILRLSPTSLRKTFSVFHGRILQPQVNVTARGWNLSASTFLPLEGSLIMLPSLSLNCRPLCPSVMILLLV